MAKDILLISPVSVRELTIVSDNLADKYLLSSIREAQDNELQEVIGSALYKKIKALIESGDIKNDENRQYQELVSNARYFLAYATIVNLILNTTYKISNIGVNTTTDENVQIPRFEEVMKLKDEYINKKDFYKLRFQSYLHNEYADGRLKELGEAKYCDIHANLYSASSSSIWLGGRRGKGYYYRNNKCCKRC